MFAQFDNSKFPLVQVNLAKTIESNEDFQNFLDKWMEYYTEKKEFTFIFDTSDVGFPPIKYCFKMSSFIKKLRKEEKQYLQKSIIIVKSKTVMRLLNLIFFLQAPVAPVVMTEDEKEKVLENPDGIEVKKHIPGKPN
tara:strand:- start:174 stop:584 length:411 start_codon:yes stop_codon:yes gene_type:complete